MVDGWNDGWMAAGAAHFLVDKGLAGMVWGSHNSNVTNAHTRLLGSYCIIPKAQKVYTFFARGYSTA